MPGGPAVGGYAAPGWLSATAGPGSWQQLAVPAAALDATIAARIWSPPGQHAVSQLPLLVVHDGPEYDQQASLTQYLGAAVAAGRLPPLRAALLSPGRRDSWYSASARYARTLTGAVLPALTAAAPASVTIGMGTSLGALAMLHAHSRWPDAFDGLFLQSGSFFTAELDGRERRFRYFRRIAAFSAAMADAAGCGSPVPVVMTCGCIEENLAGNRRMQRLLVAAGYRAALREVPDGHNYTAWRDAFCPHLADLIAAVVRCDRHAAPRPGIADEGSSR